MSTVAVASLPSASSVKLIGLGPESVSATKEPAAGSTIPRSTRNFAKQRTPLPHIWAFVPSEL